MFGWDRGFDVYVDGSDVFVNKPVGTFAADSQDDNQSRVGAAVESVKTTVFRTLDNDGFVYRSLESAYRLVDDRSLPHPDATAVVDTVVDCWKKLPDDRPTFLWVHFMETHSPYLPPPEYRERFLSESLSEGDIWRLNDLLHEQPDQLTDEEVRSISDLYDASLRYLDDELDRLFAALGLNDGWGETCLAFTADHGEQFREHGGLTHCPQPYEEGIHVPLLFRLGERTLSDVTEITSTLDIAPTLLEAALGDVETPERFWGQSLVGTLNDTESLPGGRVVFAELASQPRHSPRDIDMITRRTGCRTRRWKYVTSVDPDSPTLLFDLEEDPGEQNNVADEYQEVVKRFERLVEDHYDALAYTQYDLEIDTDVSEVQDRLRALGYVEE
jgi:arylsulfatase A-like enzyme